MALRHALARTPESHSLVNVIHRGSTSSVVQVSLPAPMTGLAFLQRRSRVRRPCRMAYQPESDMMSESGEASFVERSFGDSVRSIPAMCPTRADNAVWYHDHLGTQHARGRRGFSCRALPRDQRLGSRALTIHSRPDDDQRMRRRTLP